MEGVEPLKSLRSLRIDGNMLGPSAKLVGRLTALVQLDLSRNGLERLDGMQTLVCLEECNVSGNRLRSLDGLSGCRKMTELDASDNCLTAGSESMFAQRYIQWDYSSDFMSGTNG